MSDNTYTGPLYPRVLANPGGLTRRVEYNKDQIAEAVPAYDLPQLAKDGTRPRWYPGILQNKDGSFSFYPSKFGPAYGIKPSAAGVQLNTAAIKQLPLEARPTINRSTVPDDTDLEYDPNEPEPEAPKVFNGGAGFGTHPADVGKPLTQRRLIQIPLSGDPDESEWTPEHPGYARGTPGRPYKPWEDESSKWYGYPVANRNAPPKFVGDLPARVDPEAEKRKAEDEERRAKEAAAMSGELAAMEARAIKAEGEARRAEGDVMQLQGALDGAAVEIGELMAVIRDFANWPDMGGFEAGMMRETARAMLGQQAKAA